MSDDKDDADGSDWLSSQFDPTREVPKQPAPAVPPASVTPPAGEPEAKSPDPQSADSDEGGFSWGLRPGGAAQPPPAVPGVPTPVVPAPVVPAPVIPTPTPPAPTVPVRQEPASPPQAVPPRVVPAPVVPAPASPPPLVQPASAPPLPPTEAMRLPPTEAMPLPTEAVSQPPTEAMPLPTRAMPKVAPGDDLNGVDQPTAAFTVQPWEPEAKSTAPPATQPMSSAELFGTEMLTTPMFTTPAFGASSRPPADPDAVAGPPAGPTSAIDSLFADNKFEEYEELGVLQTISPPPTSLDGQPVAPSAPVVEHAPITTTQRTLMFVAAGLVAVIALVALFFLGQRLATTSADQAIPPSSTGAATPPPSQALVNGLAAPGVHPFAALQGGECLQPFTTAWAATYTVVSCAAGHSGQLVFKGKLPDAATAAYPTGAQFQTEITPLCSAPTAINYGAAKAVTDLQISFSYPATAQAWNGGDRTYYCFVNRSGGGGLPGDLAVAK